MGLTRIEQPKNARSRDTRRRLLDAAWEQLTSNGPEATTLEAVARGAGVTRRALYLHFSSRAELLLALRTHVDDALDIAESLAPIGAAPDAGAAVDAWAAHVAGFHSQIAPILKALDRARGTDADVAILWEHATSAWHAECHNLVRRIAAEHRLAPCWAVGPATDLLWSFMSAHFVENLVVDRGWSVQELAERLALVARRTLLSDPSQSGPALDAHFPLWAVDKAHVQKSFLNVVER